MTEHPSVNTYDLMVPGAAGGNAELDVFAPYDGQLIASVATGDRGVVEAALATAASLFGDRDRWLTPVRRIEILERAADLMAGRAEDLARGAAHEGGKPLTDSRVEIARAIDGVRNCVEVLRSDTGTSIPMNINPASANRLAVTRYEPIGVVAAVSAFNHPFNLIVHQVAPAVAAGCPVIVKPAAVTPVSCMRFVEILREAGLPDEYCQAVVTGSREASEALVTDPRVAFFSFIGSAKVGWSLRSKLAAGTRCALEHGGAAPVIVAADADLDHAIPSIVKGGFYHAGQVCVSVQRVYVDARIAKAFAGRLAEAASRLKVGDPLDDTVEVGPLIRAAEVDRVDQWVGEARGGGADVLSGGARISDTCYAPTVLYDPPGDARVSCEEIFGPVVCVYPYDDLDEAISRANALPFAFQAAVFARDLDLALRAYARLDASAVMVNDHTAFRVDWMPFAGLKQSGHGVGGIPHTIRDMQIEKMLVIRSAEL